MEFVEGAARLRGGAKALDIWRIESKLEARHVLVETPGGCLCPTFFGYGAASFGTILPWLAFYILLCSCVDLLAPVKAFARLLRCATWLVFLGVAGFLEGSTMALPAKQSQWMKRFGFVAQVSLSSA